MSGKSKILIALTLILTIWLGVLLTGLWHFTVTPEQGHLSHSFDGWSQYPVSRHLFLLEFEPGDFGQGKVYVSGTYIFVLANFGLVAPFHFLLGLPYSVAHNFIPYFYVFCLLLLLALTIRRQLGAIADKRSALLWLLVFLSLGITITDPMPWISSFYANRDNPFILTAGLFCYLSTWVFYDEAPKTELLVVGILLALWSPMFLPAWILCGLFFHGSLALERKWLWQVAGVSLLGLIGIALPVLVARLAGLSTTGSGFLFRSGLDGSWVYMTSIWQAIFWPHDARPWPTGSFCLLGAVSAIFFHYFFKGRSRYRPLRQALFLLIPYATVAIFLPQLTSIHPYLTDVLLLVP
ncbi:MAG TPA: hypothetical protein VE961_20485, partial [Pyrinomonadaceae bacterium]|nr:hypothetical protein [Pyrinomonadaceae bacterium]